MTNEFNQNSKENDKNKKYIEKLEQTLEKMAQKQKCGQEMEKIENMKDEKRGLTVSFNFS